MIDDLTIARALGGEVRNGEVLAPGPGHSAADRSLSVKPDKEPIPAVVSHSRVVTLCSTSSAIMPTRPARICGAGVRVAAAE
jgi:hypothetical protein